MVALYAAGPTIVTLTVHDHVQLDRVTGTSAERYGGLLSPGTTPVRLDEGTYVFRTTTDAQVRLGDGAPVRVHAVAQPNDKDIFPDPGSVHVMLAAKGDSPPDHVPTLTVVR
jgi:hypothetical protein